MTLIVKRKPGQTQGTPHDCLESRKLTSEDIDEAGAIVDGSGTSGNRVT